MSVPPSLTDGGLDPVWTLVRDRLERSGVDNRGRVRLPELPSKARHTLGALLGSPLRSVIDLGALERELRSLGVGDDLSAALAALGHPVDLAPARERARRRAAEGARSAAREAVATWPEPWAREWIDEVIQAALLHDLDTGGARRLVSDVRSVLDRLIVVDGPLGEHSVSRTDLAAEALGSSHALDLGTRVERAVTRALSRRFGASSSLDDLWESAGVHLDLVSGPVLTWGLRVVPRSGLGSLTGPASELGVPLHLTRFTLREHPVVVERGSVVLVVENPRVVEAAAQRKAVRTVVSTSGDPSGAVRLLIEQLLASGACLHYHGDFDAAGLAICARMSALGLVPWRMTTHDYVCAVDAATHMGVELPVDDRSAGPTPWDPGLQHAFNASRRIVHEERLLRTVLVDDW